MVGLCLCGSAVSEQDGGFFIKSAKFSTLPRPLKVFFRVISQFVYAFTSFLCISPCHYSYVVNTIVFFILFFIIFYLFIYFFFFIFFLFFFFCPGVMSACNLVMYLFISLFLGYCYFT